VSPWSIGGGVSGVLLHQWRHPYHMTLCRLWIQLMVKMLTPGILTLANLCERHVLFTNAHRLYWKISDTGQMQQI
jgi:hypothetical protein